MQWEDAKRELAVIGFPEGVDFGEDMLCDESHVVDRTSHSLKTYEKDIIPIGEYAVMAKYNVCPECREVRNKYLVVFNDRENKAYRKWFVRHGETILVTKVKNPAKQEHKLSDLEMDFTTDALNK